MDRVEGLKKIKSYEAYVESKQRLEDYLKQYKWITEAKAPYEDIKTMLVKCVETRKEYENKTQEEKDNETPEERTQSKQIELENENKILALKLQYDAIKSDTYIANLRRNITALFVTIGEYEARIESSNKKDENKKDEFLTSRSMRRFRFFLANLTGMVPGEVNMNVENRKEIPIYILEHYDLVNKPEIMPEYKETALTVVPEVGTSIGLFHKFIEQPVSEFICSRGIAGKGDVSAPNVEEDKSNEKKKDVQELENKITHKQHTTGHHVETEHKKDDNEIEID